MCPISNIFPIQSNLISPLFLSPSNSNHHSPPLLAGSNSLSFFVCRGPLLSSLRRALIWSATLNKEGKMEREQGGRGVARGSYGKTEKQWRLLDVNQSSASGCNGAVTRVRLICVFQRGNSRKGHHRWFASCCWPRCQSDREQSHAG